MLKFYISLLKDAQFLLCFASLAVLRHIACIMHVSNLVISIDPNV